MSSPRELEEAFDLPSDEAFEEVNKYINGVYNILKQEAIKVRKERETFDDVAKKLEHVHFSKMLKLNVGGRLFSTSLSTMNKDPGSMLHAMFSGRFDTKPDEDGTYFIDRDGTHFRYRYLLNYLRTGELVVPDDNTVRQELLIEAKFYQVQEMIKALTPQLAFEGSEILSTGQRKTLIEWLKNTPGLDNVSVKLLYRASRDGWNASDFHSFCDNRGPTVTVIKSKNYIFGGYSEHQWKSCDSGSCERSPTSFLFSLVNPGGLSPTKILLIPGNESNAIYCRSNYEPTFGGTMQEGYKGADNIKSS
ncbi:uncharacterized protein LOC111339875 [Stylophora pistillata]|uniref:BTB/POZ domain-containing protein KCTD6 n=1 Tax=Stylophora pistillata TaxID=50429 RepID=A0A2B4RN11_STYPI|nr:uncharacterized protein LOC111339875 [Stylophora pistillata]PFX18189.1 BTB/POZ domain-containing protein KCTD6 [Stylophora pistillata]